MSRLAPLEPGQIEDPELRELTEKCAELGVPDELFPRIIARAPEQAKSLLALMLEMHTNGTVDHQLKEIIRIQLARFVGDPYFSALRSKHALAAGLTEERIDAGCDDYEESELFTEAERMALRFSDQLFLDPDKVDAIFYDQMREFWTEAQIMEIGTFISIYHAAHLFMKTLNARSLAA
ncbi:MAG: hypothetical protein CL573_08915 [Alphaproteobacteria bacterium]|nr:hypothetical protein [Alphaproteobacteria bacterium]